MSGNIFPFNGKTPKIAADAFIAPTATIIGDVEIGPGSSIWFGTVLRGDTGPIRIGANCSVQDNSVLHVYHTDERPYPTILNDGVTIGHGVMIEGSEIGPKSLVGMNAVILPLSRIGSQSIVAAGAVVLMNATFPDRALIAGAPAKFKRELDDEAVAGNDFSIREYAELAQRYRAEMDGAEGRRAAAE
jgi:carbonic anhydrase/acetyltransferase-like protein (isoleucine patch superfamily)